jgi:large subunit ribosomal protein L25
MDTAALDVQLRDKGQKAKNLRKSGMIPAEFYGHGVENESLQMDYQTFRKLYRTAGENTVIDLTVDGKNAKKVLMHRVDFHPVTDDIHYVEFINVRMDEEVTTNVPIILEGQAPAVKELAGTLIQSLDEIEIRCLPGDLIHEIKVSVESLVDFHSALHVSDLKLPDTITLVTDPEVTIASVTPPREEEPEEAPEEVDVASVQVDGETADEAEATEE